MNNLIMIISTTILIIITALLLLPTINSCEKCGKKIRYYHSVVNGFGGNTYHYKCFYKEEDKK